METDSRTCRNMCLGTDPTNWDTDGDGVSDGMEVAKGTDPNDPSSYPFTIYGYVMHSSSPAGISTVFDVTIGSDFTGTLPSGMSITVTDPDGIEVEDLTLDYYPQFRVFNGAVAGPPKLGTYTFRATSGGAIGVAVDDQYFVRDIPIIIPGSATLSSKTPTFTWSKVSYPDIAVFYRLEIWDSPASPSATRILATQYVQDMLFYTLPVGLLSPGATYYYRIRAADGDDGDWIKVQNRSQTNFIPFTVPTRCYPTVPSP
jgi:hypothetical protein